MAHEHARTGAPFRTTRSRACPYHDGHELPSMLCSLAEFCYVASTVSREPSGAFQGLSGQLMRNLSTISVQTRMRPEAMLRHRGGPGSISYQAVAQQRPDQDLAGRARSGKYKNKKKKRKAPTYRADHTHGRQDALRRAATASAASCLTSRPLDVAAEPLMARQAGEPHIAHRPASRTMTGCKIARRQGHDLRDVGGASSPCRCRGLPA